MSSTDPDLRSKLARPKPGLRRFIAGRHRQLASACLGLTSLAGFADPDLLEARWRELDGELRDHMTAEEDLIIPAYQLTDPEEAGELRSEHARLRELLDEIGIAVLRRALDPARLHRLVELLEAHDQREDSSMYPWAERHLALVGRRQLLVRIRHWLRRRIAA